MASNVFSVDLEEWFHLLDTDAVPPVKHWQYMENRIISNTEKLLKLLKKYKTKATFFILGWVAEYYPDLVKKIKNQGHQIGSHGYSHTLVYQQTPEQFRRDLILAADAIEAACGEKPKAYRAPGFSIIKSTLWAIDILAEQGYEYDASILPAKVSYGGILDTSPVPYKLANGLKEFPTSTINLGLGRIPYLGGGYLRLLPLRLISYLCSIQQNASKPLVLYIHPRDLDPEQPRLELPRIHSFKSYVGLENTYDKLSYLLENFNWKPMNEVSLSFEADREYPLSKSLIKPQLNTLNPLHH